MTLTGMWGLGTNPPMSGCSLAKGRSHAMHLKAPQGNNQSTACYTYQKCLLANRMYVVEVRNQFMQTWQSCDPMKHWPWSFTRMQGCKLPSAATLCSRRSWPLALMQCYKKCASHLSVRFAWKPQVSLVLGRGLGSGEMVQWLQVGQKHPPCKLAGGPTPSASPGYGQG